MPGVLLGLLALACLHLLLREARTVPPPPPVVAPSKPRSRARR